MNTKIKKNEFSFGTCYILFIVSLFLDDIAIDSDSVMLIVKGLKVLVATLLIVVTIDKKWKRKDFIRFCAGIIIGGAILLCTGDFFFLIIILLGFNSINIDNDVIFQISFYTCITLTIITFLLFMIGIFPDVISYRTDFSREIRHSLGFKHSSILPLIMTYLLLYYMAIKKDKLKNICIIIFISLGLLVYYFCKSRNAIICLLVLLAIEVILKKEMILKKCSEIINFIARWIPLACILFSVVPGILRYRGILSTFWYKFDTIFTNRTLLAATAINSYGIKLINRMNYLEYSRIRVNIDSYIHTGLVLDSAYLYILIRYGILVLLFTFIVLMNFYRKEKNNAYYIITFIVMIILNMTDNDMLSYGCLPYMLIGVKNVWGKSIIKKEIFI